MNRFVATAEEFEIYNKEKSQKIQKNDIVFEKDNSDYEDMAKEIIKMIKEKL